MNFIDLGIIGVIALSAIFGLYEGFLVSIIQSVGALLSWAIAAMFYRPLANYIATNTELVTTLMYFSEGSASVADATASNTAVAALPTSQVSALIESANLPMPLDKLAESNMLGQVFSGQGISTVSEYLNQTFVAFMLNAICFMALFAVLMVLVSIITNLVATARKLPVLRQLDALAGAAFGALRGVLIVMVLFIVYPIVTTILPIQEITDMMADSSLAGLFYGGNAILHTIKGVL